jgi:hypothetical protein
VQILFSSCKCHHATLINTRRHEQQQRAQGIIGCDTLKQSDAVVVDAMVNTIGFPLVGGPAGMINRPQTCARLLYIQS